MSFTARIGLALLLLAGEALGAPQAGGARLLTRAEGESLVRRVLEYALAGRQPDCSHLMHETLTAAGLKYSYAPSSTIFVGVPEFRRVRKVQPGDLIVWRGHVGMVVDAEQQTFYSSTGNGIRVDEYRSDYWRRRGTPRFYRYLVTGETSSAIRQNLRAVAAPKLTRDTAVAPTPSANMAESRPGPAGGDALFTYEIPESIQIASERRKPTRGDVQKGISELSNAAAPALQDDNRTTSLLLVRELKVIKVRTAGNKGWAEVRIPTAIELDRSGAWKRVSLNDERWELRRGEQGWTVFTPLDRVYVAQKVAIPLLARQLSTISQTPDAGNGPRSDNLTALIALLRNRN